MDQHFLFILLASFFYSVSAGIAKRDTLSEISDFGNSIGNSIKDMVGLETNKDIIDDIKDIDNEKFCVTDAQCLEHIQFCNINNNLYGVCTFHLWFWIALAAVVSFFFCSCITSILCCCCRCCRKAT